MWFITSYLHLLMGYICYVYKIHNLSIFVSRSIQNIHIHMIEIDHKTDPGDQRSLPQSNTNLYIRGKPMRRVKLDYRLTHHAYWINNGSKETLPIKLPNLSG